MKYFQPNNAIPTATETTEGLVTLAPGLVDDDTKPISSKDAKDAIDAVGLTAETNATDIEEMQAIVEQLQTKVSQLESEVGTSGFVVGNIYTFNHVPEATNLPVADGSLIENALVTAPKLCAALKEFPLKQLTRTEEEWQAVVNNDAMWRGLQGACGYFVYNEVEDTIRLPDLRGLVLEGAGFDGLETGDVHGDMIRNVTGSTPMSDVRGSAAGAFSGAFNDEVFTATTYAGLGPDTITGGKVNFDTSKVLPTGNANKPRALGVTYCVYLG